MGNAGGRGLIVLGALGALPACAPVIALVGCGSGSPALQLAAQLDRAKLAADGLSYAGSGKSVADHALSAAAHADCRLLNVVSGAAVCRSVAAAAPLPQDARVTLAALAVERRGHDAAGGAESTADDAP